ncbi:hypothetical protein [Nonomuraea sp. KM90]
MEFILPLAGERIALLLQRAQPGGQIGPHRISEGRLDGARLMRW